ARSSQSPRAAGDRDHAGAADLDQAERLHQVDESVDLGRRAGDLEYEALLGAVDQTRVHEVGDAQGLHPLLAVARDLDQGELALDVRALQGQIGDPVHGHQLVEQRLDLLDHRGGAGGHDVDARQAARAVDLGDGQAVDVVAAPG